MKKVLLQLIAILFVYNSVYSQTKKDWENPHPENLPGYSYGFEWPTFPPLTDPTPPTPPEILRWTNDLSVMMFQIGDMHYENGKPYFIVKYNLAISNRSGQGKLDFHLKLSQHYNPATLTILDASVLNLPGKFYTIRSLSVGGITTIEDTIHVLYPFTGKSIAGQRNYVKIPVDITAEIPTNGFRTNNNVVILTDPNIQNNKAKITVISPLPMPSKKPDTN